MTAIKIYGKIDEALRKYAEENCLNVSKFIHKLVREKLESEGIQIDVSVSKDSLIRKANY